MHKPVFAAGETVDLTGCPGRGCCGQRRGAISPLAVFVPVDAQGVARPVEIGEGCQVGPFAVIYGGSVLGDGTRLDEHAIVGKPEQGYAVGNTYPGSARSRSSGPVRSSAPGRSYTRGLRSAWPPWSATTRCSGRS